LTTLKEGLIIFNISETHLILFQM